MAKKRIKTQLGDFHAQASGMGMTYAEAQVEETVRQIGAVRAPEGWKTGKGGHGKMEKWKEP